VIRFSWYHREEFQAVAILLCLIVFFARSYHVLFLLVFSVSCAIFLLYALRIVEAVLEKKNKCPNLVSKYRKLKLAIHGHAVERSRLTMACLGSLVIGMLFIHRIDLAQTHENYRTPTDIYWILFLGWYFFVCLVISIYLIWLWNKWSNGEMVRIPFLDGLLSSIFFFHGLKRKHRIVTYIATFFLGGVPSFFAIRLSPDDSNGYQIAIMLIIPLIGLVLGGAYYAMIHLQNLD